MPQGVNMNGELGAVTPKEGALLYQRNSPCPQGPDPCPPTPHYITCSKAYSMVNNYGIDEINASSEWFDKDIIQTLIKALKNQNGDGIRIYYAKQLLASPTDTAPRHGFVLITTRLIDNNIHEDYFDCITLSLKNKANKNKFKKGFLFNGGTDNGEECPTNCSGVSWP